MANIKVSEEDKRIMSAYSIKKKVKEKFSIYCILNNISASQLIEKFMEDYLKKL